MFYFMSRKRENQESVLNRRGIFKKGTGRKNLNANPKMYSLNFVIVHFFLPLSELFLYAYEFAKVI